VTRLDHQLEQSAGNHISFGLRQLKGLSHESFRSSVS
jgi:hypothetical protein